MIDDIINDINDMIDNAGEPVEVNLLTKTITIKDDKFPLSELYNYLKELWESDKYRNVEFPLL